MFEARLNQAELLKKILDAVKELVTDANFDCTDEGVKLQAMDNSHVALVSLNLASSGFEQYRCDHDMSLGMSLASLTKIIKCASNDDTITMRADANVDALGLLFESKDTDRMAEYEMKLMDIDAEHLGIPDTVYDAEVQLPAAEFNRVIRDLKELGESVKIEVSKEGVRFSAEGDIGKASVTLKPNSRGGSKRAAADSDEEEEEEEDEDQEESASVKNEDDVAMNDDDEKPKVTEDEAEGAPSASDDVKPDVVEIDGDEDDGEDSEPVQAKKKKAAAKKDSKTAKKEKTNKRKTAPKKAERGNKKSKSDSAEDSGTISIEMNQPVALTFSIKYLANFAKSTPLSKHVHLRMSSQVPLLVEYPFAEGHIRYYLAPKISDEDDS
ncbi:proliferating cell nuclear antigen [Microbotryomycetes sp. JL201]|nr:proliferating cell nuclear antigen [Microbotryomycetes sp. JL201]